MNKRKEYKKAWYQAHKEQEKTKQKAWREAHKDYMKAWIASHKDYQKAWIASHKEKWNDYQNAWKASHKEQYRDYQNAWRASHKEQYRDYQKDYQNDYRKADLNSLGETKNSIRAKSRYYLKKYGHKIAGYQIHHCCTYDEPYKFIYCSKEMHKMIHAYLRQHNIDADSDHYQFIKHLLDDSVVKYNIE